MSGAPSRKFTNFHCVDSHVELLPSLRVVYLPFRPVGPCFFFFFELTPFFRSSHYTFSPLVGKPKSRTPTETGEGGRFLYAYISIQTVGNRFENPSLRLTYRCRLSAEGRGVCACVCAEVGRSFRQSPEHFRSLPLWGRTPGLRWDRDYGCSQRLSNPRVHPAPLLTVRSPSTRE